MRRILVVLGLSLAIFVGWVMLAPWSSKEPPVPIVTVEGVDVPISRGSYGWKSLGSAVNADYPAPHDRLLEKNTVAVPAGAVAQIKFSRTPYHLEIRDWTSGKSVSTNERMKVTGKEFTLPEQPGIYIFEILARWNQGTGTFAFKVNVK